MTAETMLLGHPPAYWHRVRAFYIRNEQAIMQRPDQWGVDPYDWMDAPVVMSRPQSALWHDIRSEGAVLHPHYPVGHLALDFANPAARVGVLIFDDCDKDKALQDRAAMQAMGWRPYLIASSACLEDTQETETEGGAPVATLSTPHLFVRTLCNAHGIRAGGGRCA